MSPFNRKKLGAWGERIATRYLQNLGYRIVVSNYHTCFGEIDLVCRDQDIWCFVEVKTRRNAKYGTGFEAITREKRKHMILAARHYLDQANLVDVPVRFDIVSIDWVSGVEYRVELIKNAFSL